MTRQHNRRTAIVAGVTALWRGLIMALSADPYAAILITLVIALAAGIPAIQVWLTQQIVDSISSQALNNGYPLLLLIGLYIALLAIPIFFEPIQQALSVRLEDTSVADMDQRLLAAAERLCDLGQIERPSFGDTLRITRQAIYAIPRLPELMLQRGLASLLPLTGLLILLGGLHPLLPIALVAVAIPHLIAGTRVEWQAYQAMVASSRAAREADYCVRVATEPVLARELRIFGLARFFIERYQQRSAAALSEVGRIRVRALGWAALFGVAHALVLAGGFWYVATQAGTGLLTLGAIALYVAAVQQAEAQLFQLAVWGTLVGQSWREIAEVLRFLDRAAPTIALTPNGKQAPTVAPGVQAQGIQFRYPEGTSPVLTDVEMRLPAGRITALVGLNGAGKSTFVKLLTRMYDPDVGNIQLEGQPLASYELNSLRSTMTAVYQDFARFSLSAGENIAVGAPAASTAILADAAKQSGADQVIAKLPHGLDTPLTKRFPGGVELSGGEWQKIALARANMRQGGLIILDEPTAALDAEAEEALLVQFRELLNGRTGLIITHRMSTVRMVDHIVVLEHGRIIEAGSHIQLLALQGRYAQLSSIQSARYRDQK